MDGLKLLAAIVKEIKPTLDDCKCAYSDIENLIAAASTLASPMSFVYHVGKDVVVNGV